jgi:predicted secreted acid phosphatase
MSGHRKWPNRTGGASVRAGAFAAVACLLITLRSGPALGDDPPKCPDKETQYAPDATASQSRATQTAALLHNAEVAAVLKEARMYVEDRASQVTKPALVLDIDETSLSNWLEIRQNEYGYIGDGPCDLNSRWACGARAWDLSRRAAAIKPTLELFNAAKAKYVAVFFITSRRDDLEERAATEANLRAVGYDGWLGLILRPPSSSGPVAGYRTTARQAIEATGDKIIADVGDQHSDLDGGYAALTEEEQIDLHFAPGKAFAGGLLVISPITLPFFGLTRWNRWQA